MYLFLMVAAGWMTGCGGGETPKVAEDNSAPVPVKTSQVVAETTEEPIIYSATVEAGDRAEIGTKVMGRITGVYVKEGDYVNAGQLLVKISSNDIDAKLGQIEAQIAAATANFENAEKNYNRFEALYAKKAATEKEMDDVRLAYESAKAQKKAAEEMKNEVEELLHYVRITAPFGGVVADKFVDEGDLATPGMPVVVVERASKLKVTASVPESEIGFLSVGMPVKVIMPANSVSKEDLAYDAKISQVVPSADAMSHQFKVKVDMPNVDGSIKPGMFARIAISKTKQKTLLVPKSAVFSRGQLEGIFIVSDNRANLRWIRTGREFGEYVEVLSGLDSGEMIVLEKDAPLRDVQKVKVVNQQNAGGAQ
ncbi:efflux RND transporter periplasmic adaptor subunit [Chloroherpeton thalassium]|uniref:efflux RND transporter periplasmic adaptor subunit n=1 Tax=Chloroherpeton thalassium TaxID=100716 RepID=UPI00145D6362|nr:efflux RND transporter periplasmic adaptor subunit [Chloroherpeton thalassium]